MKRLLLLIAAAGLVLVSNAWVLISARRNQSHPAGGTVELTERELHLSATPGESTALFLELIWRVPSKRSPGERSPDWLDAAKLAELGFDGHVDVTRPEAKEFYGSLGPALVYLVLEFDRDSQRETGSEVAEPDRHRPETRLWVIDAGRRAARLRELYPDRTRHLIVRGVVRPFFQDRDFRDGRPLASPRVGGWIESVVPDRIFVPPPHSRELLKLERRDKASEAGSEPEARFAVTVSWGTRFEPWVQNLRLLAGGR